MDTPWKPLGSPRGAVTILVVPFLSVNTTISITNLVVAPIQMNLSSLCFFVLKA